jgi:predicted HAD superfamily hydrolase
MEQRFRMASGRRGFRVKNTGHFTVGAIPMVSDSTIKEYYAAVDQSDLVSFDVFDTLIHRRLLHPTDLFEVASSKLKNQLFGLLKPGEAANFPFHRMEAEQQARKKLVAEISTSEVNLDQIYQSLSEISGLTEEDCQTIAELELELEAQLCFPNPIMSSLFQYAQDRGKPIVLCSDMYLPDQVVRGLLERCGYTLPYDLFVSAASGWAKHDGTIWPQVLERFKVKPAQVVHFGDNKHADVFSPRKVGIKAFHFNYLRAHIEPKRRTQIEAPVTDRHVWSLIQGVISEQLSGSNPGFWHDIGLQIFGPLLLGKQLWFMSRAKRDDIDRILFFARDAYLSHLIYDKYAAALGFSVPVEYAYFSRASILLASFVDMPIERVYHLYSGRHQRTVGQHLARLGLDARPLLHTIRRVGFQSLDDLVPNGDQRMYRLLNMLWHELLDEAKRRRELVTDYVAQLAGDARHIGIIDIGWTGNMQGGFSRLLQLSRPDFDLSGYYYGTFDSIYLNYLPRNRFSGYLVNHNVPEDWYVRLTNGGVELLEFALTAPHGTTLGYTDAHGSIKPIFENNPEDVIAQHLAQQVQQGILAFVDAAMPHVLHIGVESLVSQEWARPFQRLIDNPTLEEATFLGDLTHSDSAADTTKRLPIAEILPAERRDEATVKAARQRAYWKNAFDVRNALQ